MGRERRASDHHRSTKPPRRGQGASAWASRNAEARSDPSRLETHWKLTSRDQLRLTAAAKVFGGDVREWKDHPGQFELHTEVDSLPILLMPGRICSSSDGTSSEWSGGGCEAMRCDGEQKEQLSDGPCLCDPEARECKPHTRLQRPPAGRRLGHRRLAAGHPPATTPAVELVQRTVLSLLEVRDDAWRAPRRPVSALTSAASSATATDAPIPCPDPRHRHQAVGDYARSRKAAWRRAEVAEMPRRATHQSPPSRPASALPKGLAAADKQGRSRRRACRAKRSTDPEGRRTFGVPFYVDPRARYRPATVGADSGLTGRWSDGNRPRERGRRIGHGRGWDR